MSRGRQRNWCFTINNFDECDEHRVFSMSFDSIYVVCGREVGECGTPHLQGFVCFKTEKSLSQMKDYLPGAHLEEKRGTFKQASEYCKKEGDFYESGELPLDPAAKAQMAISERWELAKAGKFELLSPESIKVYEYIHRKYAPVPGIIQGEMDHEWWYGDPGTGKTRKAYEEYEGCFIKDPKTKWWDGYNGEEVVVIDDFDKFQVAQGGEMKRWLDRYPFQAETKGGYITIRPRKIIVTSNYHPDTIWDDEQTQKAIGRRVKITRFHNWPA